MTIDIFYFRIHIVGCRSYTLFHEVHFFAFHYRLSWESFDWQLRPVDSQFPLRSASRLAHVIPSAWSRLLAECNAGMTPSRNESFSSRLLDDVWWCLWMNLKGVPKVCLSSRRLNYLRTTTTTTASDSQSIHYQQPWRWNFDDDDDDDKSMENGRKRDLPRSTSLSPPLSLSRTSSPLSPYHT